MSQLDDFRYLCHIFFNGIIPVKRGLYRYNNKKYSKQEFYNFLKEEFCKIKVKELSGNILRKELKQADYKSCKILNKLRKIYKNNKGFNYIILGSYADRTATAASDVDDLVIIKSDTFKTYDDFWKTKKTLDKLNHFYQQVDPVQHHGHWLFTEFDIKNYDQSVMPIVVLNDSVSMGRDLMLEFVIDKPASQAGFVKIFDINLKDARIWLENLYQNKSNLFYLKLLISAITLLLPLLFQIKGEIIDKATAIKRANEILDERALSVLEWSTKLRENWHTIPKYKINYSKLKILSLFQAKRSILQEFAKTKFSLLNYMEIPFIEALTYNDFIYYFDCLEKLKNETVK